MNVLSTIILHQQVLENHLAAIGVYHFLKDGSLNSDQTTCLLSSTTRCNCNETFSPLHGFHNIRITNPTHYRYIFAVGIFRPFAFKFFVMIRWIDIKM